VYLFHAATGKIEKLNSDAHFLGCSIPTLLNPAPSSRQGRHSGVNSDGLTDAQNPVEEMFGEEKVLQIIRQRPLGRSGNRAEFLKER